MDRDAAHDDRRDPGAWRRFWRWVERIEEAADATYDDVQDRRIARLERDLEALAARLDRATSTNPRADVGDADGMRPKVAYPSGAAPSA